MTNRPSLSLAPGLTTDSVAIEQHIYWLYNGINSGNGPYNSADGRFQQIAKLMTSPPPYNLVAVDSNTYALIKDILLKYNSGSLITLPANGSPAGLTTAAATTELINLLYKYAGINSTLCNLGSDCNATVYQPGSPATTLTTPSGQAGINLPPGTGTVTQPTVISVYRIDDPSILLHTQLDQYLYRYQYGSSSGEGADPNQPFGQFVTVEVCLKDVPPQPILGRLALAHDIAEPAPYENIQIVPPGPKFLTSCGAIAARDPVSGYLAAGTWQSIKGGLAALFAPSPLYAVATGGSTSGSLKNLSPFGAVDTLGYITPNSPTTGTGVQGGTVTAPSVRLLTPSQLAAVNPTAGMAGIPVTFTITAGGGCFANPCTPSSPTTLTVSSDAGGYASVPAWTIGVGTNTATAAASIPCTAQVASGTTADCGAILTTDLAAALSFSATGVPPAVITTASPLPTATIGEPYSQTLAATGGTGSYTWSGTGLPGWLAVSAGGVLTGTPTATGTSNFTINVVSGPTGASKAFSVTAAYPTALRLTFLSQPTSAACYAVNAIITPSIVVKVTDTAGNPVAGVTVTLRADLNNGSWVLVSPSTAGSGSDGRAVFNASINKTGGYVLEALTGAPWPVANVVGTKFKISPSC